MNQEIRTRLYLKYYPMIINRAKKYLYRDIEEGISICSEIFMEALATHKYNRFGTHFYKKMSNNLANCLDKKREVLFSELHELQLEENTEDKKQEEFDISIFSTNAQEVIKIIFDQKIERLNALTKILKKQGWKGRIIKLTYKEIKCIIQRDRRIFK